MIVMDTMNSQSASKDNSNYVELIESAESNFNSNEDNGNNENDTIRASPTKLLLMRTPWYIIGLLVLVTGVALSQYHIHLPYKAECDDRYFTNSTTTGPWPAAFINYTHAMQHN